MRETRAEERPDDGCGDWVRDSLFVLGGIVPVRLTPSETCLFDQTPLATVPPSHQRHRETFLERDTLAHHVPHHLPGNFPGILSVEIGGARHFWRGNFVVRRRASATRLRKSEAGGKIFNFDVNYGTSLCGRARSAVG